MHNFKIGDKVRCVYNKGSYLTIGREYTILAIDPNGVRVVNDSGWLIGCTPSMFEHVKLSPSAWETPQFQKPADLPKYVLVEAKNKEFLEQVNELIAKGYKPQGGVVVDQRFYIQALVLED